MKIRQDSVKRVEGEATIKDRQGRWTLRLALRADKQFWIEVRPLIGAPFAILRGGLDSVEFMVPRKREIYRIPAIEFWTDSQRRENFLALLPVKIVPDGLFDMILGAVDSANASHCHYDEGERAYVVTTTNRNLAFLIDDLSFYPKRGLVKSLHVVYETDPSATRVENGMEFASEFRMMRAHHQEFSFEWQDLHWFTGLGPDIAPLSAPSIFKTIQY